jgi:hypothetical protein
MDIPDPKQAALAVARRLGVAWDDAAVLAEGACTVVHLRPTSIVARVPRVDHLVRSLDQLTGTIELARAFPGLLVQPSAEVDPGPHVEDGLFVTFWRHVVASRATPGEVGSSLRALHLAARGYTGRLRHFDPRPDALQIARLIGGDAGRLLQAAAESMTVPELTEQPIHGDAHAGNAIAGGRWLDLDDACIGPPEWDLACLRHCSFLYGEREPETSQALAAYGPYDEAAVALLAPLVVLFTAAWGATAPLLGQPIGPRTQHRLDWLRQHVTRST